MTVSSTLVNVSEDAELRLVGILVDNAAQYDNNKNNENNNNNSVMMTDGGGGPSNNNNNNENKKTPPPLLGSNFQMDCEECIHNGDALGLLKTIIYNNDGGSMYVLLFVMENSSESCSVISLLGALLQRIQMDHNYEQEYRLAMDLSNSIMNTTTTRTTTTKTENNNNNNNQVEPKLESPYVVERKIALLSSLYNMRCQFHEKCHLLCQMMTLAGMYPYRFLGSSSSSSTTTLGRLLDETKSTTATATLAAGSSSSSSNPMLDNVVVDDDPYNETYRPRVVTLLDAWKIEMKDRRKLYRCICTALPKDDVRKQRFLLLFIQTYNHNHNHNNNDDDDDDICDYDIIKDAVLGVLRDPISLFPYQRHLLLEQQQPPSQSSSSSIHHKTTLQTKDPILYELFYIFQQGTLIDYLNYRKKKQQQQEQQYNNNNNDDGSKKKEEEGRLFFLDQYQLNDDDCVRHMRILSLCSLASEQDEIPYDLIDETLQLSSSSSISITTTKEKKKKNGGIDHHHHSHSHDTTRRSSIDSTIESWVIAAVSSGLLQAKMDQLTRTVLVERCIIRQFDMKQWKLVQQRIQKWKSNVEHVLTGLKQQQQQQTTTTTIT